MGDKLIINAAITGMVSMKKDNPSVPITVEEIIEEIRRLGDAGASVVHVHAREEDGQPT
ncbi:MAG: 3-keto-5-aminohexanoate cleavage protein, partial [Candidatus Melainabacteria bacterium]|nr:3-keto-5-aminohexanoate cleavage protein [Candidatus Melainabacteria bacterium]